MRSHDWLRALIGGAMLTLVAAPPAGAEGTFDIPAGAHFDPAKLANALVHLAGQEDPPLRFAAGADAVAAFERRAKNLLAQADAYRDLSSSLALDAD